MSFHHDNYAEDAFPTASGPLAFNIPLFEAGAEDSGFHITNNAAEPYQRGAVIQREGAVDISCELVDVVHGAMAPDSKYWATIAVLLFRFDPQRKARRVLRATIELVFSPCDPNNEQPEVESISFDGNYSIRPSSQDETVTVGVEGSVGASCGAEISVRPKWEKTITRERSDAATVIGSRRTIENVPPHRIAKWTLLENTTLESGIPAAFQVAVRVRRRDEAVFSCMPYLHCKLDRWSTVANYVSRLPKDDAVFLKPGIKSTKKLGAYNTDKLGDIKLEDLSDAVYSVEMVGSFENQAI